MASLSPKGNDCRNSAAESLAHLTYPQVHSTQEEAGTRLYMFWMVWEALQMHQSVVCILRYGLTWEFLHPPKLRTTPWSAQLHMNPKKAEIMLQVIQTLLNKNALEEVRNINSPGHYAILFLRQKPSGEWRPIIDLKDLNSCIANSTFHMESARSIQQSMNPDESACSIDLIDAYFHIPIHPKFRKYLRIAVLGKVYQFKAMPFGLKIAPRIFTKVMLEVAKSSGKQE